MVKKEKVEVLLIEDNPDHAELEKKVLLEFRDDFEVTSVVTGREGKELMDRKSFSVVLFDYFLPGEDGLGVLKELEHSKFPAPIIAVTGQKDIEVAVDIMKEGVYEYIPKSSNYFSILPIVVEKVIEKYQIEQKNEELRKKVVKSEERFRSLVENAPNIIVILDRDGVIQFINRTVPGIGVEEVIGNKIYDYIKPEHHNIMRDIIKQIFETSKPGTCKIEGVGSNNQDSWYEIQAGPIKIHGQVVEVTLIATDITERKQAEEKLKKYKFMVESAHDAIFFKDLESRYIIANQKTIKTFGLSREEIIGKNDYELMHDKEEAKRNIEDDQVVFKTKKIREFTKHMTGNKGEEYCFNSVKVPQYDNNGNITGLVGIERDVTENIHSQKEKEKLRQQLAYAENMASLGKLAGGVAHEINNPLTSVLSTAELLFEDLEEDSVCKEDIKQIIMESKRIKDTVKSFLGFARTREFVFKPTDVNKLIESILRVIGRGKLEKVRLIKNYDESIGEIKLSWFHIQEVFINIITNALHSMNDKGALMITTGQQENNIFVSIKDSGSGIEKENIDKIFEPYFTTKNKKGTGLGLSTSKIIVVQHGGEIKVKSDGKSKGSEFIIYLPKE